ncbi:MAG: radical SAM-associated putative lipoprotein [Alistipes sp.]|nr:radical SAM-associated putative lipoprotein [Alistipes sp.]
MKTKLQRLTHYLMAMLFGLLGFSACSEDEEDEMLVMYGTPTADYIVKGTVTDEVGNPIMGINIYPSGTLTPAKTDAEGRFKTDTLSYVGPYIFVDPDGDANGGRFETDTLYYNDFKCTKVGESKHDWQHMGVFELEAEVKLKKEVKE